MFEEHEKKQLNAVHEKDLDSLLEKIHLLEAFSAGKLQCKFCKTTITKENLYSILPESGTFNLICDKPECVNALLSYLEERKRSKTG